MEYEKYQKESERRVRRVAPEKDGQFGYKASEREKTEEKAPQEVTGLEMGNSHISLGINRKREVTMVLSTDDERQLREDRKQVDMNSAKNVSGNQEKIFTNSHDPKQSAVAVKAPLDLQGYGLEKRLWNAVERLSDNAALADVIPFISGKTAERENLQRDTYWRQERERIRQEIQANLEKLRQQTEKSAAWHRGFLVRQLGDFLEEREEEDKEEEEDENENKNQ